MAHSEVSASDLHRLATLVHDHLGTRPDSSLSTGQALVTVKDDLCSFLEGRDTASMEEIAEQSGKLQRQHRGNMISFLQFSHLDRELRAASLINEPTRRTKYVRQYLDSFFERVVGTALGNVAARVAQQFQPGETVVLSGYSRVIREGLKILKKSRPDVFSSIRYLMISRTGMLLVDHGPIRMIEEVRKLGAQPEVLSFEDWIDFLSGGPQSSWVRRVDKVIFGVEAFSLRGDVVYPQIVKEVDILHTRKTLGGPISKTSILAAGEAYKVCRDDREISKIIIDPHYTVMPAATFDGIITDIGETWLGIDAVADLSYCARHVERLADEVRRVAWPKGTPLPVWNLPSRLRASVQLIATDIDGTLTRDRKLGLESLIRISGLAKLGIQIVLVTGRSAGWASALSQYLPGVSAVLAENGAVLICSDHNNGAPTLLDDWAVGHREQRMAAVNRCLEVVRAEYPELELSSENFCRLTELTFLVDARIDPSVVSSIAGEYGVAHTFSSVHHHLSASHLNKSTGLVKAMNRVFGLGETELRESSLTLGDSINDGPLFDSSIFAATVGVRGVLRHLEDLGENKPAYVTLGDESDGFIELTDLVMDQLAR